MLGKGEKKAVRSSAIKEMLGHQGVNQGEDKLLEVQMTSKQFDDLADRVSKREQNPRAYERYRGSGGTKPMSYYLSDDLIKALALKSALESRDKSEIVREALTKELAEELKEVDRLMERGK